MLEFSINTGGLNRQLGELPGELLDSQKDLMEEVGTRVWHFDHGKITDFKGTYEDFVSANNLS